VDVYNFYSTGEEVLRTDLSGDPPEAVLDKLMTQITDFWPFGIPFGTYTWYWQEKGKGTCTQNWFLGSTHGGWGLNTGYETVSFGGVLIPMPTNQAALLTTSQLQTNAFFDMSVDTALFTNSSSGSSYAQANRNRILSDAIPAMSQVAGANEVPRFTISDHNINMMTLKNGWSLSRIGGETGMWHHSDFVQMAYTFTHGLFDTFVTTGNLK
jgi:hypothetical protein